MNQRLLLEKKSMKNSLPLVCLLGLTIAGLGCASRAYSDNTQAALSAPQHPQLLKLRPRLSSSKVLSAKLRLHLPCPTKTTKHTAWPISRVKRLSWHFIPLI
jgi:hypothetical protein